MKNKWNKKKNQELILIKIFYKKKFPKCLIFIQIQKHIQLIIIYYLKKNKIKVIKMFI